MIQKISLAAAICTLAVLGAANAESSSSTPDSDNQITAQVTSKLATAAPEIAPRVRVSTANGVVTLEGTVHTAAQQLAAVQAASSVAGVVKVKSRLTVRM